MNDFKNPLNVTLDNSNSFKYKASLLGKATDADGNDRPLKNTKIVVPLKYLSNFFRSLGMPLINCKIHLELNWNCNCVMYGADTYAGGDNVNNKETTFKTTSTKLYVRIVTLSTKDNDLTKQLNEGFKRSVYWNEYKSKQKQMKMQMKQMPTILKKYLLMLFFKGLIDCLLLLLTILIMVITSFKETVIENTLFQE